jgi:hypothetical protein
VSLALVPACLHAVAEVRAAWDWLTEQVVPGPCAAPSERHMSLARARVEGREARRDRDARYLPSVLRPPDIPSGAVRFLSVPPPSTTGPHPDAARVSPIYGRILVAGQLWQAAARMHEAVYGTAIRRLLRDPANRPAHLPCQACGHTGGCGCDFDDLHVAAALHVITTHLRSDVIEGELRSLLAALERANRDARRIAGAAETLRVLKAPCPVCDCRDLVADCTSPNRDEWSIRCRNALCRCKGPGCRCDAPVRYEGKAHRWAAATGQWHDLAARLGVSYTQLLADAVRRPTCGVGSVHVGSGRRA